MSTISLQTDDADQFKWSTIETERDAEGDVTSRFTTYDNGTTKGQSYDAGVLRYFVFEDIGPSGGPSDVKPWESIERWYDPAGQLTSQYIQFDTGVTLGKDFENGKLRYSVEEDRGPDGAPSDVEKWSRIEKFFDDNGKLETKIVAYDNGVTLGQSYENGVLRHALEQDFGPNGAPSNTKSWETFEKFYDVAGKLEAQVVVYDNGTTLSQSFESGVLRHALQEDKGPYGGQSDVRAWDSVEKFYDANGVIEAHIVNFASGATTVKEYENGVLRVVTQEDKGPNGAQSDAKIWDTIVAFYDEAGKISAKEMIFDNADVTSFIFEDGVRLLKLEFDGDDSDAWAVRETVYGADNAVVDVILYDSLAEYESVPQGGDWFG